MKIGAETIEKYQNILAKDPTSKVFAPLAEAYREMGMLKEAATTVTLGVQRHPQFVSGLVTHARVMREVGELEKALQSALKASQLSPENILAHQLQAEIYLAQRKPKEALKAFKMVLFLNPQSQSAQKGVQKLESLTADEYDDELFEMSKLPEVKLDPAPAENLETALIPTPSPNPAQRALERMLSLIDAFIVRNDLEKAHTLLRDTQLEFGFHPEIERRMKSLQIRYNETEEPLPLKPLRNRQEVIREKKLEALNMMLRKIEEYRFNGGSHTP